MLPFLFALWACEAGPPGDAANDAAGAPSHDGVPASDSAIVVEDHAGRAVRLSGPARSVVGLVPSWNETILALGVGDRIVARTDYDTHPALAELPSVGGGLTPSLEWLASVRPDLVIAWPDAQSRSVVGRLSELGVAVYAASVQTIDQAFRTIDDLGSLVGREAAADSLIAAIRAGFDRTRDRVRGLERPRVLYLIGLDPVMAAGPGTFVDELLAIAGADNVLEGLSVQWPQLSVEEALRQDPDIVLVSQGPTGVTPIERLREAPGWRDLEAVRQGRVHTLDPELFNRPGPRMAEAAGRLAEILHPRAGP